MKLLLCFAVLFFAITSCQHDIEIPQQEDNHNQIRIKALVPKQLRGLEQLIIG